MLVAKDVFDLLFQLVEGAAAGVALIATHDVGPLLLAHGGGARIGQKIDEHVLGAQVEQVVVGLFQQGAPFGHAGHADGLYGLDAEWFDDGFHVYSFQGLI